MPEGSWGEGGYHYIWINDDNLWTWKKLYPMERRLRKLAREVSGGDALEVATQAARELLLAEASGQLQCTTVSRACLCFLS